MFDFIKGWTELPVFTIYGSLGCLTDRPWIDEAIRKWPTSYTQLSVPGPQRALPGRRFFWVSSSRGNHETSSNMDYRFHFIDLNAHDLLNIWWAWFSSKSWLIPDDFSSHLLPTIVDGAPLSTICYPAASTLFVCLPASHSLICRGYRYFLAWWRSSSSTEVLVNLTL